MSLLVVDVASMSEPHDDNQQGVVLDCVADAVGAYPDTKARPALSSTCARRSRILREQRDGALETTTNYFRIELA